MIKHAAGNLEMMSAVLRQYVKDADGDICYWRQVRRAQLRKFFKNPAYEFFMDMKCGYDDRWMSECRNVGG